MDNGINGMNGGFKSEAREPVITETLKNKFCRDIGVPIRIFREPYFSYFMNLYDRQFDTWNRYKVFKDTVTKYGGEGGYFNAYDAVKNGAIEYLKGNVAMQRFNTVDMNQFKCSVNGIPTKDIYKETFDGLYFVLFDMVKGNFTALRHFDKDIVDGADTYDGFIGRMTNDQHFIESKHIRQVIFGNVNPSRQQTYEKWLMEKVLNALMSLGIDKSDVVFFAKDELVWNVTGRIQNGSTKSFNESVSDITNIARGIVEWACKSDIHIRAELFKLNRILGTEDGYIRRFIASVVSSGIGEQTRVDVKEDKKYDIKGVTYMEYPYVIHAIYNESESEYDRLFMYEGKLAKLMDEPAVITISNK